MNCIPCAKRKVRCDKLQPCSHCKRRKQDVCEYPVLGRSDDNPKRVEKLERYIRSLGGDPQDAEQVEESRERGSNESRAHGNAVDGTNTRLTTSENRLEDDTSDPKTPERSIAEQTALVGQDEHVTYIEACVLSSTPLYPTIPLLTSIQTDVVQLEWREAA